MKNTSIESIDICVDFDGTCVTHEYPNVGKDIGAAPVLKRLVQNGHNLILFTMRGNTDLIDAVNWFRQNEIPLYGINKNPTQLGWLTTSPKVYAELYIDDRTLGCPLIMKPDYAKRPFVDWKKVEEILTESGLI